MNSRATGFAAILCLTLSIACVAGENTGKPVTVSDINRLYIYPVSDAPATVVSLNDARVSAEAPGVIEAFVVEVGDHVDSGQPIASLDCEEHQIAADEAAASLKAATARLAFAKTQLASAKKLSSSKGIARERVEERQSEYAVASAEIDRARASLKNARRHVDNCQIEAPFSGIVAERMASVGDFAIKGMPVVRLIDTESVEISAFVQEQDLQGLEEAKDLEFSSRSDRFPVSVRTVLPVMDSRLRSFEVRLTFTTQKTIPGATGRLRWSSPWPHLPSEYLVRRGSQIGVFLLSDGIARFIAVPDTRQGRPARVDLPSNSKVIIDGRFGLEDGDRVEQVAVDPSSTAAR